MFRTTGRGTGLTARRVYRVLSIVSILLAIPLSVSPITRSTAVFFAALAIGAGGMQLLLLLMARTGGWQRRAAALLYALGTALFALFLATFVAVQLVLLRNARTDSEAERAQYLLVLGAGIRGDQPTKTLRMRLQAARDVAQHNPDCTLIVCGGQGADEDFPEAIVMRDWLVANGVAADRILCEEQSTNTIQNIANAKRILDEREPHGASTAVVSNGRHLMAQAGLDPVAIAAPSPWYLRPTFCIREYFSLVLLAATNRW